VTRWFVQLDARFRSVWPLAVEEAVAELLDQAGLLFDRDNGVQGDPGPILCAHLVIEAVDAEEAAASGWRIYEVALDAAGAEGYTRERTVTVPMADVERRAAEARARMDAALGGADAKGASQAFDLTVLRDGLRLNDPSPPWS
jgi:hypothetical protein